jgi:tRNA (guanine26-N2/guanine27-N2)-dimethyltransferase
MKERSGTPPPYFVSIISPHHNQSMALQRGYRQLSASLSSITATLVAPTNSTLPKRTLSAAASLTKTLESPNNKVITAAMSSTTNEATSTSTNLPEGYEKITEGTITMHYPKSENTVFYNPVQVQNRDLSVLMIGMYAERRAERMWMTRKRKEVRKRMLQEQQQQEGTNANANANANAESKSERKARLAQFEKDLDAEVAKSKETINFTQLTQESSNTNDGMAIFEALAASGLRSLRYWKEVPGLRTMVVNDLDPGAIDLAGENVVRNGLEEVLVKKEHDDNDDNRNNQRDTSMEDGGINDPLKRYNLRRRGIKLQVGDATHEMYMSRIPPTLHPSQYNTTQAKYQKTQYDVIDLDPYGSAAPFLDAALQSIVSGGLMCITCTDMAALGGSHPETCYGRYGAFPVQRSGYLQELALRILLYHVSIIAGRYGRTIRPVLSVGMAFYCRVFVEVWDDKAGVSVVYYLWQANSIRI